MGLGRMVMWAILGPILIYSIFLGHTICRMYIQEAEPVKVMDFPKGTTQQAKDQIIASRKDLIKDIMTLYKGKGNKALVSKIGTEDLEFEDALQRYEGREDVASAFEVWKTLCSLSDITIHGEHHGAHEVVMDWTMVITMANQPDWWPSWSLRLRSNILLEPGVDGKAEKVFRIYEDWNGPALINERNTIPICGRLHTKLRRFMGQLFLGLARLFD